jgi:hypothetical protein
MSEPSEEAWKNAAISSIQKNMHISWDNEHAQDIRKCTFDFKTYIHLKEAEAAQRRIDKAGEVTDAMVEAAYDAYIRDNHCSKCEHDVNGAIRLAIEAAFKQQRKEADKPS